MALGFLYGAGGGGESVPKREVIFENGVMRYSYDNPGGFYWQSESVTTGFSIGTNITLPSPYPSGKTRTVMAFRNVDLTDYKKFVVTYSALSSGFIKYTTNTSGNAGLFTSLVNLTETSGDLTVETDITNITGTYNLVMGFNSDSQVVIKSIWLEPKDEAKFPVIYNHGSWGVGCESKGDYTYTESGWSAADMLINSDNIAVNTSAGSNKDCIVGTTSKVDLTNYTMMKCICKSMNGMGAGRMRVCSGKNLYTQSLGSYFMSAGTSPTEFAWDISTYTGEYYLVIESEWGRNAYYYKWWLE